jgi:hypothetical protein
MAEAFSPRYLHRLCQTPALIAKLPLRIEDSHTSLIDTLQDMESHARFTLEPMA